MTQEDKAKAYDEALSVAQETYTTQPMYREWLAKMFPELAESEDERIRKELLNAFQKAEDSLYTVLTPQKRKSIIAWLEKQSKLVAYYEDKLNRCACESFNKGYKAAIEHQKEKQGEQKCVIDEGKSEIDYCFTKMMNGEKVSPTWSEEDENIRQWITSDIDKLLALKKKSHIIADKEIDWLKSLKPQNRWKPSDEQMEALSYEVDAWDEDSVNGQNLKSLYQDLKKLMEE